MICMMNDTWGAKSWPDGKVHSVLFPRPWRRLLLSLRSNLPLFFYFHHVFRLRDDVCELFLCCPRLLKGSANRSLLGAFGNEDHLEPDEPREASRVHRYPSLSFCPQLGKVPSSDRCPKQHNRSVSLPLDDRLLKKNPKLNKIKRKGDQMEIKKACCNISATLWCLSNPSSFKLFWLKSTPPHTSVTSFKSLPRRLDTAINIPSILRPPSG